MGLEAQKGVVRAYCEREGLEIVHEFTEKCGGDLEVKPILREAIDMCRGENVPLCVARLDRLSRNAEFCVTFEKDFDVQLLVLEE